MKWLLSYGDILVRALCYLGYLWAAGIFCKKYLGISKGQEWVFVLCSFIGWLFLDTVNRQCSFPYIFLVMCNHIFFMGIVFLLFQAERGKRILAASILMAVVTLVGNFCESLLSCLALFVKCRVKGSVEVFLVEWEIGLLVYASFLGMIGVVCWMTKHLVPIFSDKPGKWYAIMAVPLFVVIALVDVVNWGASNGIMVKGWKAKGLYADQIFSHVGICVLTGLSMAAVGFYLFGMARIYLEQEKSNRYYGQMMVYKMLEEQYRQSERLRHDVKNHIVSLSGLFCERMQDSGQYCEGGRFVKIQAKIVKKCFLIEIRNSMDIAEKCGEGQSSKDNPWGHGIGLLNVREVVEKYNGALSKEACNGIFVVSILIPLKDTACDSKGVV